MLNLDGAAEGKSNFIAIRKRLLKDNRSIDGILKSMGNPVPTSANKITFRDFQRLCANNLPRGEFSEP
jgi:hypothetical protein